MNIELNDDQFELPSETLCEKRFIDPNHPMIFEMQERLKKEWDKAPIDVSFKYENQRLTDV
jgi:replicative DNA helicase